jgi:hypothetical protein
MDDSWFWIVVCWAVLIAVWVWSRRIEREVKNVEKDIEVLLSKILFMRVEKHNDLMFAYDASSGDFVCQGNSMEELNTNFGIRYPNRRGIIVEAEEPANVL